MLYMQHFQKEMKQLSPTLAETMIERAFTIKLSSKKMKKSVVIVCVDHILSMLLLLLYRLEKEYVHRREKQGQEKSEMIVRYLSADTDMALTHSLTVRDYWMRMTIFTRE